MGRPRRHPRHILDVDHVQAVHDLHASQIATGLPVLTTHVVVDDECFYDGRLAQLLDDLQTCVAEHVAISVERSTFQFEQANHIQHEASYAAGPPANWTALYSRDQPCSGL